MEPTDRPLLAAITNIEPDPVIEACKKGVDRTLLRENLRHTPDERLRELVRLQRFDAELDSAGRKRCCRIRRR